jgi:anti-sigma regulatory factor (Ser/Thr protein kinase)
MLTEQISVPATTSAPALARSFAAKLLTDWNAAQAGDKVMLTVSELVSNAVIHGREPVTIRLTRLARFIRIEVADASPGTPALRAHGPDGGFGLELVARMSARWGVIPATLGKIVWCECPTAA